MLQRFPMLSVIMTIILKLIPGQKHPFPEGKRVRFSSISHQHFWKKKNQRLLPWSSSTWTFSDCISAWLVCLCEHAEATGIYSIGSEALLWWLNKAQLCIFWSAYIHRERHVCVVCKGASWASVLQVKAFLPLPSRLNLWQCQQAASGPSISKALQAVCIQYAAQKDK